MGTSLQTVFEVWRRMGLLQRLVLVTILLACGGAVALLVGWARQPNMTMLYTGLEAQEASQIVEKIRDAGVAYELRDGGTAIYAPAEKVYALRLEMAGEGLPVGGNQGYRILDEEKIGTSPFTQRINYIRAVEGELAKTIMLLEGVIGARVHVVRPEAKLFQDSTKSGSATVVLRLRPGWRISQRNVAAVVHLVAGSVENLRPEDVVVVDSTGALLSSGTDEGFAKGAGTVLDYKSQVEQYLAHKAEDMLALVLGPQRASVRVDATIETTTLNTTSEKYDAEGKVPSKEEITSKSVTSPSGAAETGPANGNTKEETTSTDYEVGRTVETTINMPGKILSLSVAAFVDLSAPPTPAGTEGAAGGAAAATPMDIKDVEEIIRSAIGLKETDKMKVVSTPFHRPAAVDPAAEESSFLASPQFYLDIAQHGSLGVLVIGALLALKIFGGAKRRVSGPALEAAGGEGQADAGHLLTAGAGRHALEGDPEQLKVRIAHALQDNPEEVKRLFRSWLDSEEGVA